MPRWLRAWLRKIASDTHALVVGAILSLVFGGGGLSIWLFLNPLSQLLERNISLRQSLVSSFGLLLLVSLVLKFVEYKSSQPSETLKKIGSFTWKVTHRRGRVLGVEGLPYCNAHECKFVINGHEWHCPIPNCTSVLHDSDLSKTRMYAESIIERLLRNPPRS